MSQTPEEIQADIERQREQLAQTVDQLGHKLDVKAQTKAQGSARRAKWTGRTTDEGKPRPEVLGAAAAVVVGIGLLIWLRRRSMSTPRPGRARGRPSTAPSRPTPDPDDPRKPDAPSDLTKRSWFYVLRKTLHEFSEDQCTDLAAALTYYAVLSIFPAVLALVSVLGVLGQARRRSRPWWTR